MIGVGSSPIFFPFIIDLVDSDTSPTPALNVTV
jgi:hypothetical protein